MKLLLKKIKNQENLFYLFAIQILVFIDFVSKKTIKNFLDLNNLEVVKVNKFINFISVYNEGIAFGMFANNFIISKLINILNVFIIFYLFYLFFKKEDKYEKVFLSLIISGGIGNLIDKFKFGAVFDFLDFSIGNLHWYTFNLADAYVCIGAFLLLIKELILKKKN